VPAGVSEGNKFHSNDFPENKMGRVGEKTGDCGIIRNMSGFLTQSS
jgi:hypothetical protein